MNYTKKSWTPEEENEMLVSIRKGEKFDKIAMRHERTTNAIKLRFGMVCKKEIENTSKSMEDICREYHTNEQQIVRFINDLETIQKKNQTTQAQSSFDPADITIVKEEILVINEKLDKIYKHVKKMMEMMKIAKDHNSPKTRTTR
jgi:hypothetical protein